MEGPSAIADPVSWITSTSKELTTKAYNDLRHLAIQNGLKYQRKVNGTWKPKINVDLVEKVFVPVRARVCVWPDLTPTHVFFF